MDIIFQPKEWDGLGVREDGLETSSLFLYLPESNIELSGMWMWQVEWNPKEEQ
jgi:hypothetical protein